MSIWFHWGNGFYDGGWNLDQFTKIRQNFEKKMKILETFEKKNSDLRGSPIPPDLDQTGSNVNNVNLEQTKSYFNDSAVLYHLNHTLNQGF